MMRSKALLGVLALGAMNLFTACGGGFFSDPNAPTTTSSTGSTTGDYVYVVNAGTTSLVGFSLSSGSLAGVSSTAYGLTAGLAPTSVVVTRQDTFVYVGGSGAIVCYSIGTGGVLTSVTGGTTTSTDVVSMATSPDGQWLLALSAYGAIADISVYAINTSTGVLTQQGSTITATFPSTGGIGPVVPHALRISASGDYVAAALGTAGDALFSFTTSTGVLSQIDNVAPTYDTSTALYNSDNALTFSTASNYLFIGTTGQTTGASFITSYPITTSSTLGTAQQIASGDAPAALETDSTGSYLYSANHGSTNISGYTFTNGVLAAMATSPFASSADLNALVRDKSGDYIIAVSGEGGTTGSNDVTLYGFDVYTPGRLDAIAASSSGTDPAGSNAVGATH
jgi:6-phosphogluconolactonase